MAPFLVILLLLALGAGIIAWHTIGYPHAPAPGGTGPAKSRADPDVAAFSPDVAAATEPIFATAPPPFPVLDPRTHDPFAHAPPLDLEQR